MGCGICFCLWAVRDKTRERESNSIKIGTRYYLRVYLRKIEISVGYCYQGFRNYNFTPFESVGNVTQNLSPIRSSTFHKEDLPVPPANKLSFPILIFPETYAVFRGCESGTQRVSPPCPQPQQGSRGSRFTRGGNNIK